MRRSARMGYPGYRSPHCTSKAQLSNDGQLFPNPVKGGLLTIRELIALLSWFQTPELSLKTPSVRLVRIRHVAAALSYTPGRALLLLL
jgi:hypothetical protein